jgi:hypothetical protein
MAETQTIAVAFAQEDGYGDITCVHLSPDAYVIVCNDVRRMSRNLERCFVEPLGRPNKRVPLDLPRLWQMRVRPDATVPGWRKKVPGDVLDPDAGRVVARLSAERLYGIRPGTHILFQNEGIWCMGQVTEYPLWREEQKVASKKQQKVAYRRRRYLRQPTWVERLLDDTFG